MGQDVGMLVRWRGRAFHLMVSARTSRRTNCVLRTTNRSLFSLFEALKHLVDRSLDLSTGVEIAKYNNICVSRAWSW